MEETIYVAITGMQHYFGTTFLKPGQIVHLIKDPENPHDQEAIKAVLPPIGKIGYVANSTYTVPKECRSAGRIFDTFDDRVDGMIRFVIKDMAIVEVVYGLKEFQIINLIEDLRILDF